MKKYWFVFCKTDIMLEKVGKGYSIPLSEEAPVTLHPWTHVLNVTPMEDGTEVWYTSPCPANFCILLLFFFSETESHSFPKELGFG